LAVAHIYIYRTTKKTYIAFYTCLLHSVYFYRRKTPLTPSRARLPIAPPHPSSQRRQLQYFCRRPHTKMLIRHDIVLLYDPPVDFWSTSVFSIHTHIYIREPYIILYIYYQVFTVHVLHLCWIPTIIIAFFGGDWGGIFGGVLLQAFRYYYYYFFSSWILLYNIIIHDNTIVGIK